MQRAELEKHLNKLLECYSKELNESEERFGLGYFIQVEEAFSIFAAVNEYGLLDSIQLRYNDYIDRIVVDSSYVRLYEDYIQYNKGKSSYDLYHLLDQYQAHDKVIDFFEKDRIYTFVLKDSDWVLDGYAEDCYIEEEKLAVKTINPNTFEIAESTIIRLQDIVLVDLLSNENFLLHHSLSQGLFNDPS